ncbi:MAG: universal stress protein [Alphaproteobacteria bacterium]|nr:universal stress protein [Alphaproteobacteria bacterium]MCW5740472.1 universal stress protein [Alphaproteobacteria bacterium]
MTYKTILVHCNDKPASAARVKLAADLARRFDAHIAGMAAVPVPQLPVDMMAPPSGNLLTLLEQANTAHLTQAKALFERETKAAGLAGEFIERVDNPIGVFTTALRYADLAVVGQQSDDAADPDLPESAAIATGRPVIVVPHIGYTKPIGTNVLLAWNASAQAAHAATGALPLLTRAKKVTLLVIDGEGNPEHGEAPGTDAARWLARHGVKVEVQREASGGLDAGNVILSRVLDLDIDLIVMGVYGHSRFREFVLGGASRTILSSMTVPVLMAH